MTQRYSITKKLHSGDIIYQCMRCRKVGADNLRDPIEYDLPKWALDNMKVSHGVCPGCFEYYKKEIEELTKNE